MQKIILMSLCMLVLSIVRMSDNLYDPHIKYLNLHFVHFLAGLFIGKVLQLGVISPSKEGKMTREINRNEERI